ncbi:hypothetical protein QVD17_03533 [Tagetes erecta]|uniref:Transferase, Chloramphenicol acetyltransferase-like domain protein n=1 Tax=Tagetes erecta TaxID=13708 RepID=A0AAD8L8H7_TARER|nr:hypothetical protein QVD17_03533 [Tagetes erecta]
MKSGWWSKGKMQVLWSTSSGVMVHKFRSSIFGGRFFHFVRVDFLLSGECNGSLCGVARNGVVIFEWSNQRVFRCDDICGPSIHRHLFFLLQLITCYLITNMNIVKQSTKFIKPAVPTPSTLRRYKTGFIDELAPIMNVSIVLFFSANDNHNPNFVTRLEQSLAKILPRFYPLAGRYMDEVYTIDCNDEGVEFIHAKVNIKLQDILVSTDANVKFVDEFVPSMTRDATYPLLAIQVTMFECGGMTLGVSSPHKIVDASTLCTFISEWATMNRGSENEIEFTGHAFNSSSLFPGRCFKPIPLRVISDADMSCKYIRKIYSFSESAISNMKANHQHWSKIQLVSAIIWKALIDVDRVNNNNPSEYILLQPVNLRGKTSSLIPKHSCGNFWGYCVTQAGTVETTEELADRLTANVKKTKNYLSKVDHNTEEGQLMVLSCILPKNIRDTSSVITITSWSKFPFYELDFGFGKPTWVAPGCVPVVNISCLMDQAQGNGVDAHIVLEAKDVPCFEKALQSIDCFAA